MDQKIFTDKNVQPTEKMLKHALGESYKFWEEIKRFIYENFTDIVEEWKYYNPKNPWTLKMLFKKRNLFFFGPYNEKFFIAFVFGDKAVGVIENSSLPKKIIDQIKNAKKYAEGRGLRIEVKSNKEVEIIKKLILIKVDN